MRLAGPALVLVLALAAGCNPFDGDGDAGPVDAAVGCPAVGQGMGDRAVYLTYTTDVDYLLRFNQPDANGLLGRNQSFGRLVSPRAQAGGGVLVRYAIAAHDVNFASTGARAIEVGLSTVDPVSGRLPSPAIPGLPAPGPAEEAFAASLFLGDACVGLLAMRDAPADLQLGARAQAQAVTVATAIDWLGAQETALLQADQFAPDRLLAHARAFHACGILAQRSASLVAAQRFLHAALFLQRADGAFTDGVRHDTDVQAQALAIGYDLLTVGDAGTCAYLVPALQRGARWLAGRVDALGQVDSTANARSCTGGEFVLGQPRVLDVWAVFRGLASLGLAFEDSSARQAARDVATWIQTHPGASPCLP
jgi:hypothetical protein